MKRGDIVIVAAPGDYGKPRPAVVIQADALTDLGIRSVALCLMTSSNTRSSLFRIAVKATATSGLEKPSQVMIDKLFTVPREKIVRVIGRLSDEETVLLNRTLAFVVGLG